MTTIGALVEPFGMSPSSGMTATLSYLSPGENPPQPAPPRHPRRVRRTLWIKDASVAAFAITTMSGPGNPTANPRPLRRSGLVGEVLGARQRIGAACSGQGHQVLIPLLV
jgi:hypothetical protein